MNLGSIGKSIASVAAKGGLKVKKCSPEILVVAGIGAIIGGGILACRATLKARGIQVERSEKMDLIDETRENNDSDVYSDQDYKNDKRIVNMQTAWAYVKLYGPSVALGVAGTAAILGGHNILKGRNIALVAAYEALQKGYEQYRARVCDELGEEKDFHFRHACPPLQCCQTVLSAVPLWRRKRCTMRTPPTCVAWGARVWRSARTAYEWRGDLEWQHAIQPSASVQLRLLDAETKLVQRASVCNWGSIP